MQQCGAAAIWSPSKLTIDIDDGWSPWRREWSYWGAWINMGRENAAPPPEVLAWIAHQVDRARSAGVSR